MRNPGRAGRFGVPLLAIAGLLFAACPGPGADDSPRGQPESAGAKSGAPEAPPSEPDGAEAHGLLMGLATVARGFPSMRDLQGRPLAEGDFAQWMEDGRLHMRIRYDFGNGRRIEEGAVVGEHPADRRREIAQEAWTWEETRAGQRFRRFEVDFGTGTATGEKREGEGIERWSEEIEVEAGRSFAGFAFTLALAAYRDRLVGGQTMELQAVVFTPEPRVVDVQLSHGGTERVRMAGRSVSGDRFDIVPQVPWVAELFVDAPDTHIWLTRPPAGFLRWEGPLIEPDDPRVRVDLLPAH